MWDTSGKPLQVWTPGTTTIVLRHFVRDYPGEPAPEETFKPTILIIIQSLSASSIYYNP